MILEEFYLDFLKENKYKYCLYIITLLYVPLSKVGIPHLYGKLIGNLNKKKINSAFMVLIMLIGLWFITQVIQTGSNMLHSRFMPKFLEFFRMRMIDNIFVRYSTNFEDIHIGDTISKIIKSPWLLEDAFDTLENTIFSNGLVILSSVIYLFYHSPIMGIVYLLSMLSVGLISTFFIKECADKVEISEQIFDRTHEEIEDTLSNLISVYTSNKMNHESRRIGTLSSFIYNTQRSKLKCYSKYRIRYTIAFVLIFAILNILSFTLFIKKTISLSTLSSIIIINYALLGSFMSVYYQTKHLIDLKGRISLFMNYLSKMPKKKNIGNMDIPNNKQGITIEFKDMYFSYMADKFILNGINLKINPGEHVAFIGKIGSGKSTTAKLIVRLFEYDKGSILLNNTEIRKLSIDSIRNNIRYIPQHPKLFNRTLYENIIYGVKIRISENEILKMIKNLDIHNIYDVFKKKMNKSVGKNGSRLSGGQRQMVWLLRALLKRPSVLILDEPTASMDDKSKVEVFKLVKEIGKKSTVILITHDSLLLDYVDRKIIFENGKIK